MIVQAIINAVLGSLEFLLAGLPDIDPPGIKAAVASLGPLWGYLGWANKYAPVVEAAAMFTLLAGAQLTLFTIHLIQWVGQRVHLLGGGG